MAAIQTTIPFKSRKLRVSRTSSLKKVHNENEHKDNAAATTPKCTTTRKRRNLKEPNDFDNCNEDCSPTKISRLTRIPRLGGDMGTENRTHSDEEPQLKELPSREKEITALKEFLDERLSSGGGGALYVSGQPGTGKTACLNYILQLPKYKEDYKVVYVNCTMIKSASAIYHRICAELELPLASSAEKTCRAAIDKYLTKHHKMTLLVLDEIDQLESKKQSVLYTLFEWAATRPRLVLVGVANALDLTERVLPRLGGAGGAGALRPRLLHFPPYSRDQIVHVLSTTLNANDAKLFSPAALQMIAAKVAAISGDMRRALDLCGRLAGLARADGGVVQLPQVLSVLSDVYGSAARLERDVRHESFPLQQKLLLCSLLLLLSEGKQGELQVGRLYDVYRRVARSRNLAPVESSEFLSLCGLLEARGLLRVWGVAGAGRGAGRGGGAGAGRGARVALQRDRDDVAAALADHALLADILADVSCLRR